ncbi:MAG TPA: BrnA antitoxin family protein [Rhizomicrobium sp.]|nr:BrnA antitoxin family protein [Rhizomicrobium sp.]
MASKHRIRVSPDDDIPETTKADFAAATTLKAAMPDVVEAMNRGRGRPKSDSPKERVSPRLDPKIVAAYKATGAGRQSRINEILARTFPAEAEASVVESGVKHASPDR